MVCQICEENSEKYKCPICRLLYCSLNCWKKHKEDEPCQPSLKESEELDTEQGHLKPYQYPTQHTISKEILPRLGTSEELIAVLANPHLRDMLTAIDSSSDPAVSIRAAMLEPIFVEFADIALQTLNMEEGNS